MRPTCTMPRMPRAVMIAGPLLLAAFTLVGTVGADRHRAAARDLDTGALLLVIAGPLALIGVRRWPLPVMWTIVTATLIYLARGYVYGPMLISPAVAVFATLVLGHRLAAWAGAAVLYGGHLAARGWIIDEELTWGQVLGVAAWGLLVLTAAETTRVRRERGVAASAARREGARRRDNEERLRIARDLHDVVAHHMSLINVQAGVALHLVDRRPEQVETALRVIKDASKEALTELRSLVGVLRDEDGTAPRAPTAMLDSLDLLVERASVAGLQVTTQLEGDVRDLPAAVELSAFRIVQEAVTNVVRHAAATAVIIRLEHRGDELLVQIDDDGGGMGAAPRPSAGGLTVDAADDGELTGSGIVGMRERAAALGGEVTLTSPPAGGTRVLARLPLGVRT